MIRPQLLDADGTPIQSKQEIPFIQWQPDGSSTGRSIDRGAKVHAQAASFLTSGGRYACVLRADGMAELVAGFPVRGGEKGELFVVAAEIVSNSSEIGPAVDRLIAASLTNLASVPIEGEA